MYLCPSFFSGGGCLLDSDQPNNTSSPARFENPVEPVTSGFLIEGHKYQYFESASTLLDLYWIFDILLVLTGTY